jgi:membrane protein DedA with SNARE-associated domain
MVIQSPVDIINILTSNGNFLAYLIIFILGCIEGPTVAAIAGFAASLGYLNLWIVLALAIFGGIIPDCLLYLLGRFLRVLEVEKIAFYFGLNKNKVAWLERNIKKHSIKSVILIKFIPPLPIPGLILTGFMRLDFKKFFLTQAAINILGGVAFTLVGFYSGLFAGNILKSLRVTEFLLPVFVAIIVLIYILSKWAFGHLSRILKTI